jgi:NAD(P)-dependent dehydrogenase (short-subunit alcohol dehydrogenase family)
MIANPFSLEGKTVLVTGASSGIGRAIAVECSKMQAKLVITGRNVERLSETLTMLEGNGHQQIITDLNDENHLKNLVEQCANLNGVVLCAGIDKRLPVKFINKNDFDEIMQTNLFAPSFLMQQLLKKKKIEKQSSIVYISSIAAYSADMGHAMYSASKGALNSFARVMALELAPQQIRVNCILPGVVDTNILQSGMLTEEQFKEEEKRYPLGRFGKPEDIAFSAIYLLSGASSWTTGSLLTIDGGINLK